MDGKRYNEEIAFRHFLHEKIANGKKLTKEERIWIETHKTFSARMGYPYLKLDYIELKKGINYLFKVSLISCNYPWMIEPCFMVPNWEGGILSDGDLYDLNGKQSKNKEVKIFIPLLRNNKTVFEFTYHSDLGGIRVSFQCEYYDQKMRLFKHLLSHNIEGLFMLREDVDSNTIIYRCKGEYAKRYDSLVFKVEFNEMDK